MSPLFVRHFGPDPNSVGGMASVIKLIDEYNIGGELTTVSPTWTPGSQVATLRMVSTAAKALLRMPPSEVAHVHLSERGSFIREGLLVVLAHMRGLVTVVTIHGAAFLSFAQRHPQLVSYVLRRADLIACLDRSTLELVRASAPAARCEIVPNPVVIDDSFIPADMTDELIVFGGEVGLRKGADVLCRAWRLVAERRPRARCVLVGPRADFVPPHVERLEVLPPVGLIELRRLVRRARVVALPSRAEGMPMVLSEAMSLARPFVSTAVGGIPDLAATGAGVLVPVGDECALADRLTELLAKPELARAMGERGRRLCIETQSIKVIDARWRKLYPSAGLKTFLG